MAIQWNPQTMSTGFNDIDEQHQVLIDRLNELLAAMKEGRGKEEIEKMLEFLGEYATWHFSHEENCMEKHRCPVAKANKSAHSAFIQTFSEISERVSKEGPKLSLVIEAQTKLADWVSSHIVRIDTHMKACVKVPA